MLDNDYINLADYDFIDFGASKGGSIEFAKKRLGGINGIGIDSSPQKVELARLLGYDCLLRDVTQLDLPPDIVRFVVMSHLLEHLPNIETARKAIENAAHIATDFLFIQGPYFDADSYLEGLGLKFYWSDWRGHPFHVTSHDLRQALHDLGLSDYELMAYSEVHDSSHTAIHPLEAPPNEHDYDETIHPPKAFVEFEQPLYKEIICYVRLRDFVAWDRVISAKKGAVRIT